MGHDIYGFNQDRKEIAYARFSMGNHNALILYRLFNGYNFYAGVSGCGRSTQYTTGQIEQALVEFHRMFKHQFSSYDSLPWDIKQIIDFINNCLEAARKEGSVHVFFG